MADHNKPTNTSLYTDYTSEINSRFVDITVGLDPASTTATNIPDKAIRFNSSTSRWEKYDLATTTWGILDTGYEIDLAGARKLLANTSDTAFTITQTGSGNAFVVEDSSSPDSTPFVIDNGGGVSIGALASLSGFSNASLNLIGAGTFKHLGMQRASNDASSVTIYLQKSRWDGTNPTSVASGDNIFSILAQGHDGTNVVSAAAISAYVDGTPGTNDMPGRLVFFTTADGASSPTERMRIDNAGRVTMGGATNTDSFIRFNGITPSTGTNTFGIQFLNIIPSTSTNIYVGVESRPSGQAASTISQIRHFSASPASLGAGSIVTNQYGFYAESNITGATNNYGFYSNIAAVTGRWNFYANGTAENYFAGKFHVRGITTFTVLGDAATYFEPSMVSVGTGTLNRPMVAVNYSSNIARSPQFTFAKSASNTVDTFAIIGNAAMLGRISFDGDDGAKFIRGAEITAQVDGTPGLNDMPGRLVFSTTPDGSATPTERTRIGSDGTLRHLNDIAFNNATVLTASYDSVSKSVTTEETNPNKLWFRPDGLRMYILGATGDDITQYTLTTAWDITTAGTPVTFSIAAQENGPQGLYFREDGFKFYIVGATNDTVYQYSCGTAWDITTSSYDSKSFSVTAQETSPWGLFFKPNGLKMYVTGNTSDTIFEYDLSTAWDVSTAVYNSVSVSVASFDTNPLDIKFTNDGYKLFVLGNGGDDITEFALSKAWDITTISRTGEFYVGTQETSPYGMFIKPDLSKFFIVGVATDTVYQYSMGTGNINLTSNVNVEGKFNVIGTPPAAATSSGKKGDIIWDSGYIYVCVENNTWKRSAIATW